MSDLTLHQYIDSRLNKLIGKKCSVEHQLKSLESEVSNLKSLLKSIKLEITHINSHKKIPKMNDPNSFSITEIADHMGKSNLSNIGKIKYVKRNFIGLKPIGQDGVDFIKLKATKNHVKDGVANFEGQIIYNFIQNKTRFSKQSFSKKLLN